MSSKRKKTVYSLITEFLIHLRTKGLSDRTIDLYGAKLKHFLEFIKKKKIKYVKQLDKYIIKDYIAYVVIDKRKVCNYTINIYLVGIKSFCKYLLEYDYIDRDIGNIIKYRKVKYRPKPVPSPAQIRSLLDAIDTFTPVDKRNKSILELFYSTGIRLSELINLDLNHLDLGQKTLRIVKGKGGKDRIVPIGEDAMDNLIVYLTEAREQFLDAQLEPAVYLSYIGGRVTKSIIARLFVKYSYIIKINPHLFRHACATHMLQKGADIRYIQELLGHSTISSTQIYTHILPQDIHQAHQLYHPRSKLDLK